MSKVRTEITNDIEITGLSDEQIEQIKKELTYDNPKYYQIMKYSKWGSTREPKYLFYYRTIWFGKIYSCQINYEYFSCEISVAGCY